MVVIVGGGFLLRVRSRAAGRSLIRSEARTSAHRGQPLFALGFAPMAWASAAGSRRYMVECGRATLLTQVLAVNLLLIVAAVVAASLAANPDAQPRRQAARRRSSSASPSRSRSLVNVMMLQRRFRPLERLVDEMERADLSRPGANLRPHDVARGPEEVQRLHLAFRARCSSGSRPNAGARRARLCAPRRRSGRGSRATCTTR